LTEVFLLFLIKSAFSDFPLGRKRAPLKRLTASRFSAAFAHPDLKRLRTKVPLLLVPKRRFKGGFLLNKQKSHFSQKPL